MTTVFLRKTFVSSAILFIFSELMKQLPSNLFGIDPRSSYSRYLQLSDSNMTTKKSPANSVITKRRCMYGILIGKSNI